ncbi:hypothetical protein QTP70_016914 [Hemibagrus guttatus]|uniref:Uncharacterized protein n=1 Tax=Hemibagrus guttatus TaxID=175788 RepID=A0AAE0QWY4_9TELE|nr:hypothetical protein QTP70_016914 [Hemibagrus guttatus]
MTLLRKTFCTFKYNSEGHVIKATFPTPEVISFQNNMESQQVRQQIEKTRSVFAKQKQHLNPVHVLHKPFHTLTTPFADHAQNMYNVNVNGSFHVTFPNVMDVTLATVVSWDGQPNNEHVHNRNLMSIAANSKIWKMKMVGWCLEHGPIAKSGASHSWRSLLCSSYIANAETFWKLTKQISFWPFSGMIKTIHVMPYGFVCTIRYRKIGVCSFI